jgi:hypothetical protein
LAASGVHAHRGVAGVSGWLTLNLTGLAVVRQRERRSSWYRAAWRPAWDVDRGQEIAAALAPRREVALRFERHRAVLCSFS